MVALFQLLRDEPVNDIGNIPQDNPKRHH